MTPTARTIKHYEALGFTADVVERRITKTVTRDFLGCIDVIALKAGEPPHFIQATAGQSGGGNKWKRRQKLEGNEHLPVLQATGKVILHSWYQMKDGTWTPREELLEGVKG